MRQIKEIDACAACRAKSNDGVTQKSQMTLANNYQMSKLHSITGAAAALQM